VFAFAEGFAALTDFGVLQDGSNVAEMVNQMAGRPVMQGCVTAGTAQVKKLQASVHWVKDRQCQQQPLVAADFNAPNMP